MNWLTIWLMYITIIIYNILDTFHTLMAITLGVKEWNPYLAYLINVTGTVNVIWLAKGWPIILLGIGLFMTQRKSYG